MGNDFREFSSSSRNHCRSATSGGQSRRTKRHVRRERDEMQWRIGSQFRG